MATRVRTAGRFANLVGSDSEPDLGGVDSNTIRHGKSRRSVAGGVPINRVKKSTSRLAGSMDISTIRRKSPRLALSDKSNVSATRLPPQIEKARRRSRIEDTDLTDKESMLPAQKPKSLPKKQRLEDSRSVELTTNGNANHHTSSSPRHAQKFYGSAVSVPKSEDDQDMDMVDMVVERETSTRQRSSVPVASSARPADKSHGLEEEYVPSLQQRLQEMTRKYQNLEERYTDLREIGVKDAERNYDRLRKQSDENTNNANKLIAKMKEELFAQSKALGDAESLRKRLRESEINAEETSKELTRLRNSLAEAERQIKALNTKLAASRAAPGSTVAGGAAQGNGAKSWTGQSELVHAAHAKEDLYGDLTGLIVQSVKQDGNEEIFDCIQTGRNGTLHFKLSLCALSSKVPYEESSVKYSPQLQPGRDSDLINRLPDYLREDIKFDRPYMAIFYSKVLRALKD